MNQIIMALSLLLLFNFNLNGQWQKVESITSQFVYSALFADEDIFVGGDSLYISRDRGVTWEATTLNGQTIEITALFKSGNKIFAGTYGSGVFISSDNGLAWQNFNSGLTGFALYAKKFIAPGSTIFYASDGGGIYFLLSISDTWQSYNQNLPSNYAWTINDITATSNNLIVSAGASGYYYLRPKGSAEWIEKRMLTPQGVYITPNAFLTIEDVVFAGSRFGIYKSIDEGNSFDSIGISAMDISVVSFAQDTNRIYAGYTRSNGNDFFIWYSDDLGITWKIIAHEFHYLHSLYIYDNKIWAATTDGLWYYPLELNSANPINSLSHFNLYQNFPNPFNPNTNITWQTPVEGWSSLKIYDLLGNEVATLVDEYKTAGNFNANFDASELVSGMYFYQLKIGAFSETKKMLLLK